MKPDLPPAAGSPPPTLAGPALEALGYALFARDGDDLRLSSPPPAWLTELWPGLGTVVGHGSPVPEASPFLENFLVDAVACWERGGGERVSSGPWVEGDPGGTAFELEATALTLEGGQAALVIERLGADFAARKNVLQVARETVLLNQRLNAELQKKSVLLHCLAEEMTASLGNITTALRLIERESDPASVQRLLDLATLAAQEQQEHLDRVLENFVDELGDLYGTRASAPAEATARRALAEAAPAFATRRVRLLAQVSLADPQTEVAADAGHLERALGNLLSNALTVSEGGSEVIFHVGEDPESVCFAVEDSGDTARIKPVPAQVSRALMHTSEGVATAAMRLRFCQVVAADCHGDLGRGPREGVSGNRAWITVPKSVRPAAIPNDVPFRVEP